MASAGQAAMGTTGLVAVTVAAVFSTGSAINATLFATARLTRSVADNGQLPAWLGATNDDGTPFAAVITIGTCAAALAAIGHLARLVEAASLVFLVAFAMVTAIAWRHQIGNRIETAAGTIAAATAALLLLGRLATDSPTILLATLSIVAAAAWGRSRVERRARAGHQDSPTQDNGH